MKPIKDETLDTMTDAALGAALRSYLGESNHQGWDGFSPRDLTGIRNFVRDLALYAKNIGERKTAQAIPGVDATDEAADEAFDRSCRVTEHRSISTNVFQLEIMKKCMIAMPPEKLSAAENYEVGMLVPMIAECVAEKDTTMLHGFTL